MNKTHQMERSCIMIVEDSYAQAGLLRRVLESEGVEVVMACNGAEAFDLLQMRPPALIISDVVMPVMDGYVLCQKVKGSPSLRDVPFMLLSQLSHPADIFKGLEAGADYYSLKPYDPAKLRERVVSILHSHTLVSRPIEENLPDWRFAYEGQDYAINSGRRQILDLLLATFDNVAKKNHELQAANQKLSEALRDNKALRGLIPICSYCKKVRDDRGYWEQVDSYVARHLDAKFSHGICPHCAEEHAQDFASTTEAPPADPDI